MYDPNQPRDPKGVTTGGQWTSEGATAEKSARNAAGLDRTDIMAKAAAKIETFEKQIVDQDFESAAVYDSNGQMEYWRDGEADKVGFSEEEVRGENGMYQKTMTHNHPNATTSAFSAGDIKLFEVSGLAQMRAVAKDKIYTISRDLPWYEKFWKGGNEATLEKIFTKTFGDSRIKVSGVFDGRKSYNDYWIAIWKEYAKRRKFTFTVEDR